MTRKELLSKLQDLDECIAAAGYHLSQRQYERVAELIDTAEREAARLRRFFERNEKIEG